MSIKDEIKEFVSKLPINHEFSTKWFKSALHKEYGRAESCYIPSDYSYNMTNKGIKKEKQPEYFLQIKRGVYKYVGENHSY